MSIDPTITIGGLFTLLATLGLYLYQWLDKSRARKWAREDAELVASDLKQEAAAIADKIAIKLAEEATKVADEATERSKVLAHTVTENITTSAAAIKVANALNAKIADLSEQLLAVKRVHSKKRRRK